MPDYVFGYIVLFIFAFSWPLEKASGWVFERLYSSEPPSRPAAPRRTDPEQLSPAQARRLSDWLADWYRLRIDEGTNNHRGIVEDAIARIYKRRRRRLGFRWVDSPWAALVAGARPRGEDDILRPPAPRARDLINRGLGPRFATLDNARIRTAFLSLPSGFGDMRSILSAQPETIPLRLPDMEGVGASFDDHASYLACRRAVLGLRYDRRVSRYLDLQMRTARCFGWSWRDEDVVVVSERPTEMHRDDRGRLHHPRGAAVRFRDGFAVHVWHGTVVPESWITAPEALRPHEVLRRPDTERRTAALEIIGWKRVIEDLQPRTIDAATDPAVGELVEARLPGSGRARFLRVRCGTGREFVLAVPWWMQTALEANAWTYGLSANEYNLEART